MNNFISIRVKRDPTNGHLVGGPTQYTETFNEAIALMEQDIADVQLSYPSAEFELKVLEPNRAMFSTMTMGDKTVGIFRARKLREDEKIAFGIPD